jgi:hypothetical protein
MTYKTLHSHISPISVVYLQIEVLNMGRKHFLDNVDQDAQYAKRIRLGARTTQASAFPVAHAAVPVRSTSVGASGTRVPALKFETLNRAMLQMMKYTDESDHTNIARVFKNARVSYNHAKQQCKQQTKNGTQCMNNVRRDVGECVSFCHRHIKEVVATFVSKMLTLNHGILDFQVPVFEDVSLYISTGHWSSQISLSVPVGEMRNATLARWKPWVLQELNDVLDNVRTLLPGVEMPIIEAVDGSVSLGIYHMNDNHRIATWLAYILMRYADQPLAVHMSHQVQRGTQSVQEDVANVQYLMTHVFDKHIPIVMEGMDDDDIYE